MPTWILRCLSVKQLNKAQLGLFGCFVLVLRRLYRVRYCYQGRYRCAGFRRGQMRRRFRICTAGRTSCSLRCERGDAENSALRAAEASAGDGRLLPENYVPIPEDAEAVASRRVLRDETLQRGDIVTTKNGKFVFQGRSDKPRDVQDFVPIVPDRIDLIGGSGSIRCRCLARSQDHSLGERHCSQTASEKIEFFAFDAAAGAHSAA